MYQTDRHRGLALLVRAYNKSILTLNRLPAIDLAAEDDRRGGFLDAINAADQVQLLGGAVHSVGAHEHREAAIALYQTDRHRGLALLVRAYNKSILALNRLPAINLAAEDDRRGGFLDAINAADQVQQLVQLLGGQFIL